MFFTAPSIWTEKTAYIKRRRSAARTADGKELKTFVKVTIKKAVDLMACPICGKDDKVVIEDRSLFDLVRQKYGDALLEMNCNRCNLRLAVYPQEFVDKDYDTMLTALVERWNTREEL
jgi:hypothetical protein